MPESDSGHNAEKPVGVYLRETREARGLCLDDAAKVTRIGKNYLEAIEAGKFDKLPNLAYVKGFLRIYAGYLGLSGDTVVGMFERDIVPRPPLSISESASSPEDTPPRSGKGRWLIPFMLLILVLVVAYLLDDKQQSLPPAPQVPSSTPPANVTVPVLPVRTSVTVPLNPAANLPELPPTDIVPPTSEQSGSGIVLRLKINQDSWLNITIDGSISQQYDLKAGDLIEWKGERLFSLDVGNAGGIEGEFNGKPLKSFGEPGKTAHIELKADGP